MGSLCIAILIAQDLIAVVLLMFIHARRPEYSWIRIGLMPVLGAALILAVLAFEQFVLRRIMRQIEFYHELLYLLSLAYCFGVAMLAEYLGFSREIGAFLAGVALARNPISFFLSEGLKFFRDFFLVLFFFVLGAKINLLEAKSILLPALLLGVGLVGIKTFVFRRLFAAHGEAGEFSREMSVRLNQASEFSFILAVMALELKVIGERMSQLIQMITIVTMILSSYLTVTFFPTPLGVKKQLKRD
jgi:Kef-type K+ transport system membrane component KefB